MTNKKYVYSLMALATFLTLATAVLALADNTSGGQSNNGGARTSQGMMNRGNKGMMRPVVFGTVSVVSGNIITVTSTKGPSATAVTTTYTVDATNAKIMKNNVAGTVSSIVVGDTIMAQGTLTGTNLVATTIRDGVMGARGGNGSKDIGVPKISPITGNGQPIVAGTVSSVSGSTITITNKSNVTYTIDATNAKIVKGPNTALISDVTVGDIIIAQGTINGNAVVATSVIDQAKPVSTNTTGEKNNGGFFSGVGSFFSHLFGF